MLRADLLVLRRLIRQVASTLQHVPVTASAEWWSQVADDLMRCTELANQEAGRLLDVQEQTRRRR